MHYKDEELIETQFENLNKALESDKGRVFTFLCFILFLYKISIYIYSEEK